MWTSNNFLLYFEISTNLVHQLKSYLYDNFRYVKLLSEKSIAFYKEHRERIRKKLVAREKVQNNALASLKSNTKLGFLYEFTSDITKAFLNFNQAYTVLYQFLTSIKLAFDIWEIKAYADCIILKLLRAQLSMGECKKAFDLFSSHYTSFKQDIKQIEPPFEYLVIYAIIIGV